MGSNPQPVYMIQTAVGGNDKIIFLKNFVGYPVEKNTSEEPTFFPEYSEEYLTPVCNWE
jgi:hypothetical protein